MTTSWGGGVSAAMVVKVTLAKLALPLLETCPIYPVDLGWTRRIFKVLP
jgi:hypothetical protein